MTLYGHMVETDLPVFSFNLFSCLCWSPWLKIGQILAKNSWFCPPRSGKFNLGVLILCWDIFNGSLRSYMMENDLPVCVLICLDVMLLFRTKIGKKEAKNSRFCPPKLPKIQSWCFATLLRNPRSMSEFILMETDLIMCVLIYLDVYGGLQDLRFVENEQEIADFVFKDPIVVP